MNPLEQLATGWMCLGRSIREARTWAPWAPALVWAAAHALIVFVLVFAAHPWLSGVMAPLLRAASGEDALRYPELFRRMPGLVTRAGWLLAPLLAPLLAGAATVMFTDAYRGRTPRVRAAWDQVAAHAGTLLLASLPFHLVLLALTLGLGEVGGGRVSVITRLLVPRLVLGAGALLQALLLLVPPLVLLERRGLRATFAALPEALRHGFLGALMIASLAALLPLPFDAWAAKSGPIVNSGLPEKVAAIVLLRALAQAAAMAFAAGSVALLYRTVLADRDEWER